jgi:hypothetical protein
MHIKRLDFTSCGKTLLEAGSVTEHGFRRAAKGSKERVGFTDCGKTHVEGKNLPGHDFSHAARCT